MTAEASDPGALHRRRDADSGSSDELVEDGDGSASPMDISSLSEADKAKLRKELAGGLVVGQWVIPFLIYLVGGSGIAQGRWMSFVDLYPLTLLCNAVLIMAVGYLVQGRIEHWHIRPSMVWVVLPLALELLRYEPWMFGVISLVVCIPFACVFMAWCARYGVKNTFCMGWQYLQRCFALEGMFSRRIVAMTKRHIYDFDALQHQNDDEESQDKTKAPTVIEKQHSPEDLARIRANTTKHLRPYIGLMVFVVVWGVWLIFSSARMVALYTPDFDLGMRPPTHNGFYAPVRTNSNAHAHHTSAYQQMTNALISPQKEILTVTIQKEEGAKLGISAFPNRFGKLTVTKVKKTGLLAGTEIKEGMELFGINGIDVSKMSIEEAAEIVKEAKGTIEIIALKDRGASGTARHKEVVTATLRNGDVDRLGLRIAPYHDGKYIIGGILDDGAVAGTAVDLRQGMEVFSINGVLVDRLSHEEVLELMRMRNQKGNTVIKAWAVDDSKPKTIPPVANRAIEAASMTQ